MNTTTPTTTTTTGAATSTRTRSTRARGAAVLGAATAVLVVGAAAVPADAAMPASAAASNRPAAVSTSLAARAAAPAAAPTGRRASRVVYLTFDDGPNRVYTPQVLDLLRRYRAKATFFMIGSAARANPALVARVRSAGHAIGNHTFSHPWLSRLPASKIRSELRRTDAVLGRTTCLRPPGGFVNGTVRAVARSEGKSVQLWTVDTNDWRRPGASTIGRRAVGGARTGSVVLMHDGGGPRRQTVAALATTLARLSAQGYRFERLPACR